MHTGAAMVYATLGTVAGVPLGAWAIAWRTDGLSVSSNTGWLHLTTSAPKSLTAGAISGVLAGLVGAWLGFSEVGPAYWLTAVVAVPLIVVDLGHHRLPYAIVVPIYGACLVSFATASAALGDGAGLVRAVVAGVLVAGIGLVLALVVPGQLGLGDVVLAGALGVSLGWLGWRQVEVGMLSGLVIGALAGVVLVVRRRSGRVRFALGPALLVGWLIAVFFG